MKKQNSIVIALNNIIDDGFCQYTHHRAYNTLKRLAEHITNEEYKQIETYLIWTDSDNPDVWNGYRGIDDSLKITYELFVSYMKTLIEKYKKKGLKG